MTRSNESLKARHSRRQERRDPGNYCQARPGLCQAGLHQIEFPTYDTDWDSRGLFSVSGQNSNNSIRVTDAFLKAVENDDDWNLINRKDGKTAKTIKARDLWEQSRPRRLGLRRSRHPVSRHRQRLAHLSSRRRDSRLKPVFGIHVPGRHGLQPGLDEPADLPRKTASFRSTIMTCDAPVDRDAGNRRD